LRTRRPSPLQSSAYRVLVLPPGLRRRYCALYLRRRFVMAPGAMLRILPTVRLRAPQPYGLRRHTSQTTQLKAPHTSIYGESHASMGNLLWWQNVTRLHLFRSINAHSLLVSYYYPFHHPFIHCAHTALTCHLDKSSTLSQ